MQSTVELFTLKKKLTWVDTNTLTWELIGTLTWVNTNTITWELIGTVTWVYTNTLTWELIGIDRTRPDPDRTAWAGGTTEFSRTIDRICWSCFFVLCFMSHRSHLLFLCGVEV